MIFNSFEFIVFFIVFFILYWWVGDKRLSVQNIILLSGSYLFYAWWDWRFLSLLVASSVVTYFLGIAISQSANTKRHLLVAAGLIQAIGILSFFKYYNFFVSSLVVAFSALGFEIDDLTISIILPLGISFYTFRIISYILDVDKGKVDSCRDIVVFLSYVSFFPTLISGPIDRANTFIPQLKSKRVFDYNLAADGMRQILWGLFKKIVIADNCSPVIQQVFSNYDHHSSFSLLLVAILFTVQVYADFSGYSDMAIGFSRLLGFNVMKNFDFPYFAETITDFWRRWHISLTKWLTDYIFTPLTIAFRNWGSAGLAFAIIINMIACGIWHGANWTFIVFGLLHGLYFVPFIFRNKLNTRIKSNRTNLIPTPSQVLNISITFFIIVFTNILFRAETLIMAINIYKRIFLFSSQQGDVNPIFPKTVLVLTALFFVIEWIQRDKAHALEITTVRNPIVRLTIYYCLISSIIYFGSFENSQFLYFKF